MEWVVSLESAGEPATAARCARLVAGALRDEPAAVDVREGGYGVTILVDCEDPQQALGHGVRLLRAAERRAGVRGRPLVCAEVTAAGEVDGVPAPGRPADPSVACG